MKTHLESLTAGLLLCAITASAQETRVKEVVAPKGATSVIINCEMSAAQISIKPVKMTDLASADIYYTPDDVRYKVDYQTKSDVGYLDIMSKHRSGRHDEGYDDSENEWDVTLSTEYPMELLLDMSASDANFDLGGLPLTTFRLNCGAMSGTIDFSSPNPKRMKNFSIDVGASSLDMRHVGDANFENLIINCGASSLDLDLRGTYTGESTIDLDVGVGSADIILPRDVAVRIECDDNDLFSSIDIDRDLVRKAGRGAWETENYDTAKNRITLMINVSMGNADIRFK